MRADFSRWSFDLLKNYEKHYAGVLHQQGRVWLDADWNEDVLARLFLLQQETQDIIGDCGTPEPGTVGHTQSHGCIRLTNWDASELAKIVKAGTPAVLKE